MQTTKPWWMSKTIWMGLLMAVFALATAAGVVPPGITETLIDETVTLVLGLLTIIFRKQAVAEIAPAPTV